MERDLEYWLAASIDQRTSISTVNPIEVVCSYGDEAIQDVLEVIETAEKAERGRAYYLLSRLLRHADTSSWPEDSHDIVSAALESDEPDSLSGAIALAGVVGVPEEGIPLICAVAIRGHDIEARTHARELLRHTSAPGHLVACGVLDALSPPPVDKEIARATILIERSGEAAFREVLRHGAAASPAQAHVVLHVAARCLTTGGQDLAGPAREALELIRAQPPDAESARKAEALLLTHAPPEVPADAPDPSDSG